MRGVFRSTAAFATVLLLAAGSAQAQANEQSIAVTGGGIFARGWAGMIDASEAAKGMKLENAKLEMQGNNLKVTTGPAVAYWNPANTATGDYTVKATFREDKFMALNDHAHPYGLFIGGKNLGTDQQSYLYCSAYGNGGFIVRGFGPAAFQLNGRRAVMHEAVNKAAGKGESVTQEIAISVKGDQVSCSINGQVVATYPKADVVAAGKLTSTDGIYGIRFGHNTEAVVTGLSVTKN
jgi:hypothetical protein